MTRDTKDALIVTNCGAEAISFLKVYGVIPAATAFMITYSRLASSFSPKSLFYITLFPFLLFYAAFAFILYPARNILHPMSLNVPDGGMAYVINLLRHWTFSLYYIVSELWGSAGVPLLFWSCANDVVKIEEAKRIYPLISLIGNLGPILSGITMSTISKAIENSSTGDEESFEKSLKTLTVFMTAAGALVASLHWYVHKLDERDNRGQNTNLKENVEMNTVEKESKPRLSLSESMKVLAADKYLRNIAIMVVCYGLSIEFTEIIWKSTVKRAFPGKTDYLNFMGRYSTMVGMSSFVMTFIGSGIVKSLGWRAGALMTPVVMGVLGLPFFASICFGLESRRSLFIAVYVGKQFLNSQIIVSS